MYITTNLQNKFADIGKRYQCQVNVVCFPFQALRKVAVFSLPGYSVSLRIQSECGKIRTRKTSNTDTFHAVCNHPFFWNAPCVVLAGTSRHKLINMKWYIMGNIITSEVITWHLSLNYVTNIKCTWWQIAMLAEDIQKLA